MKTKGNYTGADSDGDDGEAIVVKSLRLTARQDELLKARARRWHRTVSQEMRLAIDNHLANDLEEAA